jgi:hypothetical protein
VPQQMRGGVHDGAQLPPPLELPEPLLLEPLEPLLLHAPLPWPSPCVRVRSDVANK